MTKTIKASELPDFDITEFLETPDDIAAYLTVVLEEDDPEALIQALGDVSRARGMTEIAKAAGVNRESLYRALQPGSHPRFETIAKVCKALGVRLATHVA